MASYLATDALAGPYLADQLLPFALAGAGSFTTVKPERFLDRRHAFTQQPTGTHLVKVQ